VPGSRAGKAAKHTKRALKGAAGRSEMLMSISVTGRGDGEETTAKSPVAGSLVGGLAARCLHAAASAVR
jgi:hypothetical protein